MVAGAAGTGKSALLRAFASRVTEQGARSVYATGSRAEMTLPLALLSQLLRDAPLKGAVWQSALGLLREYVASVTRASPQAERVEQANFQIIDTLCTALLEFSAHSASTAGRTEDGPKTTTSAATTRPGTTRGSSATGKPAPTSTSTPGPRSSGMPRSQAAHPPMTRPRPVLGRPQATPPAPGPATGTIHPARHARPAWTMPPLREPAPARRPAPRLPQPVGNLVPRIRTAITRQAITVHTADGQTGDHHPRLMHTDCHRRHPDGTTTRTAR
jgi:hypothetical protein